MDPTEKSKTISTLKRMLPDLSRQQQKAAKYIVDHPADFGLHAVRLTARNSGVSTYTYVRLARLLGFASFDALREPFRQSLVAAGPAIAPDWQERFKGSGELARAQSEAAQNSMAIVHRTLGLQKPEQLQRVSAKLVHASNIYVTAARASFSAAHYLHYVGRMALPSMQLIPRQMNSPVDDLYEAQEGDVLIAITYTPYSRETIEACRLAQSKGADVILIADSEIVAADLKPTELLLMSAWSTHHFGCLSGAMVLVENLLALVVAQVGENARSRIEAYDRMRRDQGAYWTEKEKH